MRWRNWNWLDLALLPLLMAVMRACWLAPWLAIIQRAFAPTETLPDSDLALQAVLSVPILVGLPLLSFWLARFVTARLPTDEEMSLNEPLAIPTRSRFGLALIGLLAIIVTLWWHIAHSTFALWDGRWVIALGQLLIHIEKTEAIPVWIALITLIFLWLRGLLDAGRRLGHDDVWSAMSAGITAVIFYLIVTQGFAVPIAPNFSNWIVLFFGTGMTALAFSGLKMTVGLDWALSGTRRTAKTPPLTRYWLLSVGIVVGLLLGLSIGIGFLVAPEQVARWLALLNGMLSWVWRVLATILLAIAYVVFVITYYILELFRPLIQRLMESMSDLAGLLPPPAQQDEPLPQPLATALETIPDPYRWVALVIFLAIVAVIFALIMRRLRAAREVDSDEVRESILSSDLLQDQLAKLWNRLWGDRRGAEAFNPFLTLDGEADTRRTIRQIYQQLLTKSGERGLARQRGQTPHEYRGRLNEELNTTGDSLARITERYNHARYAPDTPTVESAQQSQEDWKTIEPEFGVKGDTAV